MSRRLSGVLGKTLVLLSLAAIAIGQTQTTVVTKTKTEAVQNPDGTYTIVEYPVGKETVVTLTPIGLSGATGTATILRAADGTAIKVNLASLPAEVKSMNVYAVDPTAATTFLGMIEAANAARTFNTTLPPTQVMLISSPKPNLS